MKVKLGQPYLKKEIILKEIEKTLDSKWISGGETISNFENAVKEYNDDNQGHYIAVSNGTDALEMSLLLLNNGKFYDKSDEIIVPSWSWVASGFVIPRVGATPVWCDVNEYGVPYAEDIEKRITNNTRAIIVVHQMGIPCDINKINELSIRYSIPVIEDAACGFGSEYKNTKLGKSDNIVTYSFQARKVLTTGEGGMIIVRDKTSADWLRSYRQFGTNNPPFLRDQNNNLNIEIFDKLGGNYKMCDINAAVGLAHLKYVDEEIALRQRAGNYYNERVKELSFKYEGLYVGNIIPDYCTRYNWQNYHIILDRKKYFRDDIVKYLKSRGVGSKWDIQAIHLEPAVKSEKNEFLPKTNVFHSQGLWLPFFAEITQEEQDYALSILEEILNEFN